MRTVPRDAFLPGIELENAYTDQAVTAGAGRHIMDGDPGRGPARPGGRRHRFQQGTDMQVHAEGYADDPPF
ncbi:hypothetical protein ACH4GE_12075 [Streptomyces tendae]|uniref:hypothetical protein n=1 Tax=Streptomyces TaxID=1883 RepID=UPI0021F86F12|nr:hypothetical protein [Streptomyces sp. RS2]MCW1099084.1 hypothetical protein [Streptomyces sp. RS2]